MNNITSLSEIRDAIVILEAEQEVRVQQLRQQFQVTYVNLKPVNLLKSAVQEIASTPVLTANFLGTTTGLALGYLTRKVIIGASGGMLRKIFGSVLQFGVTNLIARHPAEIKSISQFVNQSLFGSRKVKTSKQ
ncbi:MAG: hypothetical protein K0B37_06630 [Bacteroidales bacterium]|nr:hypothetical protein [Bacteroidales bacterium]